MPSRRHRTSYLLAVAATGILAAGLGAVPAGAAEQLDVVYVSPTGDDTHAGHSWQQPLRTLTHARDVVRDLLPDATGDVTVRLLPGTYRLDRPLQLDARDSGTDGHKVIWTAAVPGAPTVVSGADRITGWRPADPARHIWAAPAPAGLDTRQLYVDGVRADRARGPVPASLTATPTGYSASNDTLASWPDIAGAEFVYTGGDGFWSLHTGGLGGWTEPRCPIAAASGTTVTMAQPCWDNSMLRVNRTDGSGRTVNLVGPASLGNGARPSYVENAYELLDQPGEWYLDKAAHEFYYIPRPGQDLGAADVEAPALESLVSGAGTEAAPLHDIAFRGIRFEYATWLRPSTGEGLSEIQATYSLTGQGAYATQGLCQFIDGGTCPFGNWTRTPGNVSFGYDRNIELTGDVFAHLGAAGLDLGDGSQHATVTGDVFTDISANGIELGGVDNPLPTSDAQRTTGNHITDNHLYGLPAEYHGGVAIDVGYTDNTLIAHNQIDHTAYTGISIGWGGWPDKIKVAPIPNDSHDNTLADNLIFDHLQLLSDGGGIYTQGITGTSLADGEKVTGNVIHDQIGHGHGVYTDNGCTFESIVGNVLYNTNDNVGGRHADYAPPHTGEVNDPTLEQGNWWQQGDPDGDNKGLVTQDNHIVTGPDQAPADVLATAGIEPAYRGILGTAVGASVPGAPGQATATAVDGAAYVSWTPSFVTNGSDVTSYTVTAAPGGQSVTVSNADYEQTRYAVVPGLADGTAYTFTVTARNASGDSAASLPTGTVTPEPVTGAVPGAPTGLSVRRGTGDFAGNATIRWTPPAAVGGSPVTSYVVSAPGVAPVTLTGQGPLWANKSRTLFTVVSGLVPGRKYTFSVAAVNALGTGPAATKTG